MSNLIGTDSWDDIYQMETTDQVIGGALPGGISNKQAQQLLNRTEWLKKRMGIVSAFAGFVDISSSATLLDSSIGMVHRINANNATITISLPDAVTYINCLIPLIAYNVNKSQVIISGNIIFNGNTGNIYLGNNEQIILCSDGVNWNAFAVDYNADQVGDVFYSYQYSPRAIPAAGQLLNRVDFPRLWNMALKNNLLVSELNWLSKIDYQGFFSYGDEVSTFRVPDLRGQFIRGFDNNRGLDNYRTINSVGGYELDDNKQHSHVMNGNSNGDTGGEGGIVVAGFKGFERINDTNTSNGQTKRTVEFSGTEARPKNIGLIPQIYV